MKLEDKFFQSFFYPFLVGVLLSMLIVTIFLGVFTNNYFDKRTGINIVNLEKKYASMNINSINSLLTTTLLKIQASLNEQILFYQKLANRTSDITNYNINKFLKCVLDLDEEYLENNKDNLKYTGFWFKDNDTRESNLTNNSPEKLQLIVYSNIIQNVYSTLAATKSSVADYIFFFENTDIFISFPIEYYNNMHYMGIFQNYSYNPAWCCDSYGEVYKICKFKCRNFYTNIKKAKLGIFDYNTDSLQSRSIFITNSYKQLGDKDSINVFTMCIEFYDPISNGPGYSCADIYQEDLIFSFDNFNSKLVGYYLITSVGFNNVFYFPSTFAKTPTENIFRWDRKFFLEEKTYFINHIQKLITSNYNNYIGDTTNSIFEEIKINGVNTSEQYFYFNKQKYFFSLFPVILENLNGVKEHVLSIVYFYNNQLYYDRLKSYRSTSL